MRKHELLRTNLPLLKLLFALAISSWVMMLLSWRTSALPSTSISSAMLWTFGMPPSTLSSLCWKTSPATLSPNGSHSHLNLPHGVLNVVIRVLSLSTMICQYPDLVSGRVNSLEPCMSGTVSSIVLLYHWFCLMFLLRSFGSIHKFKETSGFFTGTTELTHLAYSLTSVMLPNFSSLSSSAL